MAFGKKKKEPESIQAGTIDGENVFDAAKEMDAAPTPPQKLTPEQTAKVKEIQEHLAYFGENYGQIDFGNDLNGLKNLLFGILIELRKLNQSQEED